MSEGIINHHWFFMWIDPKRAINYYDVNIKCRKCKFYNEASHFYDNKYEIIPMCKAKRNKYYDKKVDCQNKELTFIEKIMNWFK